MRWPCLFQHSSFSESRESAQLNFGGVFRSLSNRVHRAEPEVDR